MRFPKNLLVSAIEMKDISEFRPQGNGTSKMAGVEGEFLNILAKVLGFSYTLVSPSDKEWGRPTSDGNWTGIVGMIMRGEADMAVGMAPSSYRAKVVDFSLPYSVNEVNFAANLPQPLPRTYAYLYPFDLKMWIALLVLLLTLPLAFCALSKTKLQYVDVLVKVVGNVLRQPLSAKVSGGAIMNATWWLMSTLISFSYAAVLASFLSVPLMEPPLRTFAELDLLISRGEYKLFSSQGSMLLMSLYASERPDLIRIAEAVERNGWFVSPTNFQSTKDFSPRVAALGTKLYFHLVYGKAPFSWKFVSDDVAASFDNAVMFGKSFCCKAQLDVTVTRAVRAGLYQKLLDDQMFKLWIAGSKEGLDSTRNHKLSLSDVSGATSVLVLGYCASLAALILEIVVKKVRQ